MKLILVGVILIGMTYIGYGIARFYRKRKRFFEDIILLCEKLCVDISFSKESLSTIISNNINFFSKDFKNCLDAYLEYLANNGSELSCENMFKKSTIIKEEEKEAIILFFKSLGRLDASNQISEINNFKIKFLDFKQYAEQDNKKFGSLSFKLMLLLGVLVVIILL